MTKTECKKEKLRKTVLGTMSYTDQASLMAGLAQKDFLTVQEAAVYFNVGINRLYNIVNHEDVDFVVPNGKFRMISREKFKEYILAGNLADKTKQR